ncbi:hypothetical protein [Rhizobium sp. MHM7A]|uniref:hypothetical protein n=1 Tax=Rhizobium sp. MHM7A TaxID=2583233 RepID=UPI001106E19F|nr:hypothetical protein [Rhizobium sp. MHM7A]TLX16378.1 hypothetical protein FFR93_03330 [Rhizobium sp. MHM7A]
MSYFFGKPDVTALALTISDRGWNLDNVEIAVIPTVVMTTSEFEGSTSTSISTSPPVISLLHGNAVLPLSEDTPVMHAVGSCLEAYFRLPEPVDRAHAPVIVDRDNALLIVPAKHLINRYQAFERAELAARAYDRDRSEANWQARLSAEWARFQLEEAFAALPCDEATFRAIFSENASLKHPHPFLETYRHYWQSKQANLDGEQPSDFAIAVSKRCVKAGIAGKWTGEIAAEVIRSLHLHPLHYNLFHAYVAELLIAEGWGLL